MDPTGTAPAGDVVLRTVPTRRSRTSGGCRDPPGDGSATCTCRSGPSPPFWVRDFNTLHLPTARSGRRPGVVRRHRLSPRSAGCRAWRRRRGPDTVFAGGGNGTLLDPGRPGLILRAIDDELGLVPGLRSPPESNPDSVDAASSGRTARGRFHTGVLRHAVRGPAGARDPGPHHDLATGARRRAVGARRRFGEREPGPYSTARRGSRSRTGRPASRPGWLQPPTTSRRTLLIVEDGTALARRVRGVVTCRCRTRTTSADKVPRRRAPGRGVGLGWYEVSNWRAATDRHRAATTSSTGPAGTGGASDPAPGQPRRRRGGGTSSTRRPTPTGSARAQPGAGCGALDDESRRRERVLLELRLRDGTADRRARRCRSGRGGRPGRPGPARGENVAARADQNRTTVGGCRHARSSSRRAVDVQRVRHDPGPETPTRESQQPGDSSVPPPYTCLRRRPELLPPRPPSSRCLPYGQAAARRPPGATRLRRQPGRPGACTGHRRPFTPTRVKLVAGLLGSSSAASASAGSHRRQQDRRLADRPVTV